MDFAVIGAAYYAANRLRFDVEAYAANAESFYGSLPIVLAVQLVAFFVVGVYRGEWHIYGTEDAVTAIKGVVLGVSAVALFVLPLFSYTADPRMLFVYYAAILSVLIVASRAFFRLVSYVLR